MPTTGHFRLLGLVVLFCAAGIFSLPSGAYAARHRTLSAAGQPLIVFKDETLTVRAQDVRLDTLLDAISRLIGVAILLERGAAGERVSVELDGLPLDQALRRLLRNYDAFFYYGAEQGGPAALRVVWVYPMGRARGLMPVPPETWASTKELEPELRDPDPGTRGRAIETLIKRKGASARDVVLRALADPDGRVRSRALYTAVRARLDFPVELLTRLALEDSSPHVRFLALEALETKSAVIRPIAERTVDDPDPHVRSKAQEILKALDRAARRARASGGPGPVPAPGD